MLDNLPIKKEYLLIAGTFILLILCYQLAFKRTIEAWQEHKRLNAKLTVAADPGIQPSYVIRKNANLLNLLNQYRSDTTKFRSIAINQLTEIAQKENVKLSMVPSADPAFNTNAFVIQKLQFEGDYFGLERVLNDVVLTPGIGAVRSVNYDLTQVATSAGRVQKLKLILYFEMLK